MKKLILLLLLSTQAWAESPFVGRNAWNFGAHIGVHRAGDLFNFEVSGPSLMDFETANIPQSTHLTLHLGFNNSYNFVEKASGLSGITQSFQIAALIESQTRSETLPVQVWSRIGPGLHSLPQKAFKSASAIGLHLGLGADFAFLNNRSDHLFGSSTPSLSIGVAGLFGLPKAENLASEPDLLTGFSIQVGLRNHF